MIICAKCKGRGHYTGINQETSHVGPMRCECSQPLFPLGRLCITPGAKEVLDGHPATTKALLTRHASGDWSEMSAEDQAENQFSVSRRLRVFSAYTLADETKLWIITEADRSATTILLPSEY